MKLPGEKIKPKRPTPANPPELPPLPEPHPLDGALRAAKEAEKKKGAS